MDYSHFSILGYAVHQHPHGNKVHGYRIVNPAAHLAKREHFFSGSKLSVKEYSGKSEVSAFQDYLSDHPNAFVWFHSLHCGHCIVMKDAFYDAASRSKDVSFIKVDANDYSDLCAYYQVRGFPTMKLFKNGEESDTYSGDRSANSFLSWLSQRV
jgi:thiol-disulfide isomerase/thioredoxin